MIPVTSAQLTSKTSAEPDILIILKIVLRNQFPYLSLSNAANPPSEFCIDAIHNKDLFTYSAYLFPKRFKTATMRPVSSISGAYSKSRP